MRTKRALACGCMAIVATAALVACGGGSDDKGGAKNGSNTTASTSLLPAVNADDGGGGDSTDVCALLSDDDVSAVIGDHEQGASGLVNGATYGKSSCVWDSTGPLQASSATPDQVEVSVLSGDIAAFARRQDAALGEPFPSFGHDAQWQESYGRLWFDCGDGKYCHVRIGTAESTTKSGESRQDAAVKLGQKLLADV